MRRRCWKICLLHFSLRACKSRWLSSFRGAFRVSAMLQQNSPYRIANWLLMLAWRSYAKVAFPSLITRPIKQIFSCDWCLSKSNSFLFSFVNILAIDHKSRSWFIANGNVWTECDSVRPDSWLVGYFANNIVELQCWNELCSIIEVFGRQGIETEGNFGKISLNILILFRALRKVIQFLGNSIVLKNF